MKPNAINFFVCSICLILACSFATVKTDLTPDQQRARVTMLLSKINERPDPLHLDYTPAVQALIDVGRPALRYGALELLLSDDYLTRMHAWRVVEGVTLAEMGWKLGRGWPSGVDGQEMDGKWRRLWRANGAYSENTPEESRRLAYQKWRQWLLETDNGKERKSTHQPYMLGHK